MTRVPDHFLAEYLWKHVTNVDVFHMFLWAFGAMLFIHALVDYFQLKYRMREDQLTLLTTACCYRVGAGIRPYLVFLTPFTQRCRPLYYPARQFPRPGMVLHSTFIGRLPHELYSDQNNQLFGRPIDRHSELSCSAVKR